ncbi:MAG TPA: hypothetical protein VGJ37_04025 [Pyrinomonadaceae bacterium]|jgi:hypothetical protein
MIAARISNQAPNSTRPHHTGNHDMNASSRLFGTLAIQCWKCGKHMPACPTRSVGMNLARRFNAGILRSQRGVVA